MLSTLYHLIQFLSVFLSQDSFRQMFQMCSLIKFKRKNTTFCFKVFKSVTTTVQQK